MVDRVFDHYVMGNMQRFMAAFFVDTDGPGAGGLRDEPYAPKIAAAKAMLRRSYGRFGRWLPANSLPPRVSLMTRAAAPSLFYADWVEPAPKTTPASPRSSRAARAAGVARCVDDACPNRPYSRMAHRTATD